jgi:hypothetical protein
MEDYSKNITLLEAMKKYPDEYLIFETTKKESRLNDKVLRGNVVFAGTSDDRLEFALNYKAKRGHSGLLCKGINLERASARVEKVWEE